MSNPAKARPTRYSAATVVNTGQVIFFTFVIGLAIAGTVAWPMMAAKVTVAAVLLFFAVFVGLLKMGVWFASTRYRPPKYSMPNANDESLPLYTVFVPMYLEGSMVAPMVRGMCDLVYPKSKLRVMLLVETRERDPETRDAIDAIALPRFIEVVEVPAVKPYGKQRALDYGAHLVLQKKTAEVRNSLCVVYDAEDRPEPTQLLKAVGMFRAYAQIDPRVICLQARLAFSNETSSWVSRLMWVEYAIHFEWVLPGLAHLDLVPPLGGTSNHFRLGPLQEVGISAARLPKQARWTGIWDIYNVTEDADLAGAIALHGYKIAILDSVTYEVATTKVSTLIGQRSRWLKGYIQTGLIFGRRPFRTMRSMGPIRWFVYELFLLGTPLTILFSTLSWALTYTYFATRSPVIQQLFPVGLLYVGVVLLVFGNFALFMQHVAAANKREGYGSVKYLWVVLCGIWQMLTVLSLAKAVYELINPRKRHFWDKTNHGHDLHTLEVVTTAPERRRVLEPAAAGANVIPLRTGTMRDPHLAGTGLSHRVDGGTSSIG
jgi:cellulose synthase/poly-beta-1,6-N-acetylglucosamine synthase-like glycosyltransferase